MATWQDGPEYAPLERPDVFALPPVAPLEVGAPPAPLPTAPPDRPRFDSPAQPVAPLAALVPVPADLRDPQQPFAVVADTLTAAGAWGSAHGTVPQGDLPLGGPATAASWPALGWAGEPPDAGPASPGAFPSRAPGDPYGLAPAPDPVSGFPAPGTPAWFSPGAQGPPAAPVPVDLRQVLYAATHGLVVVLVIGILLHTLAPVLLVLAFVLCRQAKVAQTQLQRVFAVGLGSLGFFAVAGLLSDPLGFGDWWNALGWWASVICATTLVVALLLVRARLRARSGNGRPTAPPPTYPGPWG